MAYASRSGRARTNARDPRAHAICDRCGFRYNHVDLKWQMEWAGAGLQNLRILVCDRCYDTPQEQLRSIVVPADPVPIVNARPEYFQQDEIDYASLTPGTTDPITGIPIPNTTIMTTVSGEPMTMQPVGKPKGYTLNAQMPIRYPVSGSDFNDDFNDDFGGQTVVEYDVRLPVISILSAGTTIITVTTSTAHGLSNNSQVGLQGVLNRGAAGVYSVMVTTPTQFTYQTGAAIPSGSLLMANTLVITMNMGIPLGMIQVPQTGS